MIPTKDQVDTYFERLVSNYDDLIKLLGEAKVNLNTIFNSTDTPPSRKANRSEGWCSKRR
jgi:hypothetical protein